MRESRVFSQNATNHGTPVTKRGPAWYLIPMPIPLTLRLSSWAAPRVLRFAAGMEKRLGGGNSARLDLAFEHWPVVSDGRHNLTTDLIRFGDELFLVYSSSPWHIASTESRIVVKSSPDGKTWRDRAVFSSAAGDIRDPKLAVVGDRLLLYFLTNEGFVAEPGASFVASSADGDTWTKPVPCGPKGWLFWRPKTFDGKTWFAPAYWHEHGQARLFSSRDGVIWEDAGEIHRGDHNDETDIEFFPDGTMVATARLEMSGALLGHPDAATLVAFAKPPYREWTKIRCARTRLDGPNLFAHDGEVFALGRRHDGENRRFNRPGGFLGKKRTALFRVSRQGLQHLTDLPSAGDTGYPGVVKDRENLLISYYTNRIDRDYRWVWGMFLPSEIRFAKIPLAALKATPWENASSGGNPAPAPTRKTGMSSDI